jgi:hypothetical protein
VIRWHRRGFRAYWRWKSRQGSGRPTIEREIRELQRNPRPDGVAFPMPEKLKALAVPADESFGPDDGQGVSQFKPPTAASNS